MSGLMPGRELAAVGGALVTIGVELCALGGGILNRDCVKPLGTESGTKGTPICTTTHIHRYTVRDTYGHTD